MRDNTQAPSYILSLSLTADETEAALDNLGIKGRAVVGVWEGDEEASVVISAADFTPALKALVEEHEQEAVLFLDGQRCAFLVDAVNWDAPRRYVGEFKQVPEAVAKNQPAYTYDKERNIYYCAR